jgi:Fructosamine kinase
VDNTIGGSPQPNGWMENWVDFYRERRLGHQLQLAGDASLNKLGEKLLPNLEHFFQGVEVGARSMNLDGRTDISSVMMAGLPFDPGMDCDAIAGEAERLAWRSVEWKHSSC